MTTRPPLARPGNGYGRSIRPGPDRFRATVLLDEARGRDQAHSGDQRRG